MDINLTVLGMRLWECCQQSSLCWNKNLVHCCVLFTDILRCVIWWCYAINKQRIDNGASHWDTGLDVWTLNGNILNSGSCWLQILLHPPSSTLLASQRYILAHYLNSKGVSPLYLICIMKSELNWRKFPITILFLVLSTNGSVGKPHILNQIFRILFMFLKTFPIW